MKRWMGILMTSLMTVSVLAQEPGMRERPEGGGKRPSESMRRGMGGPGGGDGMMERGLDNPELAARLGVDKEALQAVREKNHAARLKQVDLQAELEKAAMEQARMMSDDAAGEDAILDSVEKAGRIRTEMAKQRIRTMLMMRDILTPEQREKIRTWMLENRRDREGEPGQELRETLRERMREKRGDGSEEPVRDQIREKRKDRREAGPDTGPETPPEVPGE